MRLTLPESIARFGDIEIRGFQQVLELEAHETSPSLDEINRKTSDYRGHGRAHHGTQAVYPADLQAVQARTAIVVPCKGESIDRMRGVWAAIPANSLIIVVSGSTAQAYAEERDSFKTFCAVTRRSGICVHQSDWHLAEALRDVGMNTLLDDDGIVHKGKGEGMVVGTMLAAIAQGPPLCATTNSTVASVDATDRLGSRRSGSVAASDIEMREDARRASTSTTTRCDDGREYAATRGSGQLGCSSMIETASTLCRTNSVEAQACRPPTKLPGYYRYIGFIDADNYVPGSVQEYCKAFSAGLALADADDAMVRISWSAKPKVKDGRLEFRPSGRCSQIMNLWVNRLLRHLSAKGSSAAEDVGLGDDGDEDEADEGETNKRETTDHICTACAGEHAMSLSLALKLRLANGYAIEPFHFLDMFERLAGDMKNKLKRADGGGYVGPSTPPSISPLCSPLLPSAPIRPSLNRESSTSDPPEDRSPLLPSPITLLPDAEAATTTATTTTTTKTTQDLPDITPPVSPAFPCSAKQPARVQIFQIRTLSPHFHDNKGEAHVVRMWQQGLCAIYHSPLTAALTKYRNSLRTAIFAGDYSVTSSGSVSGGSSSSSDGGSSSSSDGSSSGSSSSSSKSAAAAAAAVDDDLLPTPPATNGCVSVAVTPPDVSIDKEDRGINGAAVEAAASWQPEKCRVYPAPGSVDLSAFRDRLASECGNGSFWWNV